MLLIYTDKKNHDIEVGGVIRLLADLQDHKAHHLDDNPARLLKETAVTIAPILTLISKAFYTSM